MKQALLQLSIEQLEAIHNYLQENPVYDRYEQPVEMDDLDVNENGDIGYCYSWKVRSECNESTGYNTVNEMYDEQYNILLTKHQLDKLIKEKHA